MSSSGGSDAFIKYDGTQGIAYTKFKHDFQHYLVKHVVSKAKDEDTKIKLLQSIVTMAMKEYTQAHAWLKSVESDLWNPKHIPDDKNYIQGKAVDADHLTNRFWRLADKQFKKATKADLMEWHKLFQRDNETPAAFGARFSMYKEIIETILPIPCDWSTYVSRLHKDIAFQVGTLMDSYPVAEQNLTKAIDLANSMWDGLKLRDFLDTMHSPQLGGRGRNSRADQSDDKGKAPAGKWCPLHKSTTHDATECKGLMKANANVTVTEPDSIVKELVKTVAMLAQRVEALQTSVKVNPNVKFNNASGNAPGGNRPPGTQKVVRCTVCGNTRHTIDNCWIEHPDQANENYLGPRKPELRARWEANRAKLGMTTINVQTNVAYAQQEASGSNSVPDPATTEAHLADLLHKFNKLKED